MNEYKTLKELVKNKCSYTPVSVCMVDGSILETTIHDIRTNSIYNGLRGTIGSYKPPIKVKGVWKKGIHIKYEINVLERGNDE